MSGRRSEAEEQVADLLQKARKALRLPVAFLSRLDETTQHYEIVESDIPGLEDGFSFPRQETFCQAVLDGRLPPVMPDIAADPLAMRMGGATHLGLRSYAMAPVLLSD